MKTCATSPSRRPGFTVIELLVVAALIGVLIGTVGLVRRSPGKGVALQAAQATVASLCGAARGRAGLTGRNARLLIAADPVAPECYLRYFLIVHEEPAGSDRWRSEGAGVYLPRGVYLVPPAGCPVPGAPTWPASRQSTACSATVREMVVNGTAAGLFYHVQFSPRGTTSGGHLVLTVGRVTADAAGTAVALENPDDVRGVLLRPSGALTLIDDARAFSP